MKYTTYYEDSCMIGYSGYEQMKAMVERENPNGILEHVKVRKLKFENTEIENQRLAGDEGIPLYSICLKNLDENRLYLEKKSRQNQVTYKSYTKLTREECEKILNGDVEWMKTHKKSLCRDFYLQYTINNLRPTRVREYEREIGKCKDNNYITFNLNIRTALDKNVDLFAEEIDMMDCLSEDKVAVSYKKETKIPRVIANVLHIGNEQLNELATAL
ncbi:VTC domain-containing protein [Diplocloster modestus]|uniref:VTC domain-containing protein n=1 Tax=Diplocloster modestus TaxID=2850322 RepID=A0ABS6K492_9FIRM|nr:VTC domain-containing protein [Diplocloster modestus]MBU9725318.1 hypothetical protein [Diplocloster modestus]